MQPIEIIPFQESYAGVFARLNKAWLETYFVVEPIDAEMLEHPQQYFIDHGGHIYFAKAGDEIVGTFALLKSSEQVYELSKMAVDPVYQGMGVGNRMLEWCIARAREMSLEKIILYSSTRLSAAIHLYQKYGFKEVPLDNMLYKRSDIKMELPINNDEQD